MKPISDMRGFFVVRHTKLVSVATVAVVLGLVGSACSSGGGDSSPETATTEAVVEGVVAAETVARPDTTDATTTSAPADPGTEQAEPVPSAGTAGSDEPAPPTSGSAEAVPSVSSSGSVSPEVSEPPSSTTTTTTTAAATASTTSTTTTSAAPPTTTTSTTTTTTTTTTTIPSADDLRVQVLNGSGISGAAGRLTARLEAAGWDVLPAGNAPSRYAVSAVYYSHDVLADQAAEIAVDTGVGGVVSLAMPSPAPFVVEGAGVYVVVLIGADDLGASLRPPARASGLRPRPRSDVALPLPASVPRDRFVPGLADIQIFSAVNDNSPIDEVRGNLDAISSTLNVIGRYSAPGARLLAFDRNTEEYCEQQRAINPQETCIVQDYEYLQFLYTNLERAFAYFGFTPQNVCGAPAGYSFTDLLEPTREWNEEINTWSGDAIFTTDRLIELHGGPRINPEDNLNFYISQAVQTAHDSLRLFELLDETEAPQMILCRAWKMPSAGIPGGANAYWYALLTPGTQPRTNLLSQGTYHLKDMSRNGNLAYVVVCHPALGEHHILLHWREAGYRAELLGASSNIGCQAGYESQPHFSSESNTFKFGFGERVFSASDLMDFPRN